MSISPWFAFLPFIIIGSVCIFGFIFAGITIIKVAKSISDTARSVSPFIEQIKEADMRSMTTPKTLDGTEPVRRPMIMADFPEFNIDLAKNNIGNFLIEYLNCLNSGQFSTLKNDCSKQFYDRIVTGYRKSSELLSEIRLHKVVISDYKKSNGNNEAVIVFQAAVQYLVGQRRIMTQAKYRIDYSYFLDIGDQGENASLRCPHCGAPVSSLGMKVCPACDSLIQFAITRTWKVTDIGQMS